MWGSATERLRLDPRRLGVVRDRPGGGRHASLGWELASLLVTLGYPLILLVGAAHAAGARASRTGPMLGPLLVALAALPGVAAVRAADGALHDRRFTRHLTEVEAALERVRLNAGERTRVAVESLPVAVRECCARTVVARRDSLGSLSATLLGQRNVAYLYDPSGRRLQRGIRNHRWRAHAPLAPAWYRVTRF
jgi:hypothetical protein